MKLPTVIKVGPLQYKVLRVPQEDIPEDNACIDPNEGVLKIRKRARTDNVKMWVLHELLHACHLHAGKYDNTPRPDEEWIDATTPTLLQIIIDNPKLIEFFQSVPPKRVPKVEGIPEPKMPGLPIRPEIPER